MTVKMQQRRGTAAQWTSANPVLAAGEIGVETDTLRAKIGNGSTAWASLTYFTLENGSVGTTKLADSAVTSGKIADGAVTAVKLADNAVTSGKIAANAVGASELADNAVDTAAIAADAVGSSEIAANAVTSAKIANGTIVAADVAADTFAAFGTVGNLLTANQASGTDTLGDTTGFGVLGGHAIAASSWGPGVAPAALLCTYSGTGAGGPVIGGGATATSPATIPVTPGALHTFQVSLKADENATFNVSIYWFQANGTTAASTASTGSPDFVSPNTATVYRLTATAPDDAAFASVYIRRASGANGIVWSLNRFSLHRGAGGVWSMPGVPVVGGSAIASNGAVNLSGTGVPEARIYATPGSTFLQTDSVTTASGWHRWVKSTGVAASGWVPSPESDTGWRYIDSLLNTAAWSLASGYNLKIRRRGERVTLLYAVAATATPASKVLTVPTGFTPATPAPGFIAVRGSSSANVSFARMNANDFEIVSAVTADGSFISQLSWLTDAGWPTSLPGTATP